MLLLGLRVREKRALDFLLFFGHAFFGAEPWPFPGLTAEATPGAPEPCPFPEPNKSDTRASIGRSRDLTSFSFAATPDNRRRYATDICPDPGVQVFAFERNEPAKS